MARTLSSRREVRETMQQVFRFLRQEDGTTAMEYGLMAAMIGTVLIIIGTSEYGFGLKLGFQQIENSFGNYASF
jgi:Flp pilus assembly pilin Flp